MGLNPNNSDSDGDFLSDQMDPFPGSFWAPVLVAIFGVAGIGALTALLLVYRKNSSRRTRNRESELLDELARTISVINHGYISLDRFARIVVRYASVNIRSTDRDINALVNTLAGRSGLNIPVEQTGEGQEGLEDSIREDFISSCAPANGPVNPQILIQMKEYLVMLGFIPAGQPAPLGLEDIQGVPEEWVLEEIAERFTYPGVRSF